MRYNLACYECQLGRLEQAKKWLQEAFQLGDAKRMKLAALGAPDLQPLWKEIVWTENLLLSLENRSRSDQHRAEGLA